jgi:FAD/FMN-containing dehydrogenase
VTGFIVEAVLRLAPLPQQRSVTLRAFDNSGDLLLQRERWLASPNLTALEYVSRTASATIGWEPRLHLLAEFDSSEGLISDPRHITELWRARDGLYPVLARQGYPVIEDPQVNASADLGALLTWLESESIPAFGHLGVGIMRQRAESIGATLTVESDPGQGTRVTVVWQVGNSLRSQPPSRGRRPGDGAWSGYTFLYVKDRVALI